MASLAPTKNPDILILDEPMNGLDPSGIVEIRELILKLNREKHITFLISSHILSELSLIATKYGIISKGRMIKEISNEELKNAKESANEAKSAYEDLYSKVSDYKTAEEALKKCTKGTQEWKDAFQEVLNKANALIEVYP